MASAVKNLLVLGQCIPTSLKNAAKVRVKHLDLDKNLLMYFRSFETIFAHDPQSKCKPGDIVLIEALPEKLSKYITHEVKNVIYPWGDITDPISGKKVVGGQYREDVEQKREIYGKIGFDYESAPPRGWQEGRKDFSHIPWHTKYHEPDEGDAEPDLDASELDKPHWKG